MIDREIIIALAEKVMEWKYKTFECHVDNPGFFSSSDGIRWLEHPTPQDVTMWNPLESISDAWELLNHGEWNYVISKSRNEGEYYVAIVNSVWAIAKHRTAVPEPGNPNLYSDAFDASLPRAISMAVYRAAICSPNPTAHSS